MAVATLWHPRQQIMRCDRLVYMCTTCALHVRYMCPRVLSLSCSFLVSFPSFSSPPSLSSMQFGKPMADVHPEVVCQLVEDGVYDTTTIIGYELKPCELEQNLEPEPCRESDASSVYRVSQHGLFLYPALLTLLLLSTLFLLFSPLLLFLFLLFLLFLLSLSSSSSPSPLPPLPLLSLSSSSSLPSGPAHLPGWLDPVDSQWRSLDNYQISDAEVSQPSPSASSFVVCLSLIFSPPIFLPTLPLSLSSHFLSRVLGDSEREVGGD